MRVYSSAPPLPLSIGLLLPLHRNRRPTTRTPQRHSGERPKDLLTAQADLVLQIQGEVNEHRTAPFPADTDFCADPAAKSSASQSADPHVLSESQSRIGNIYAAGRI